MIFRFTCFSYISRKFCVIQYSKMISIIILDWTPSVCWVKVTALKTMADFTKKSRKSNFSQEEVEVLVKTVGKNYDILYGEYSKRAVYKDARHQAWLNVTNEVNQVSLEKRTLQEVKNKWKKCQHLYKFEDFLDIYDEFGMLIENLASLLSPTRFCFDWYWMTVHLGPLVFRSRYSFVHKNKGVHFVAGNLNFRNCKRFNLILVRRHLDITFTEIFDIFFYYFTKFAKQVHSTLSIQKITISFKK